MSADTTITHYDISATIAAKDGSAVCLNVAEELIDTLRAFAEQRGLNFRTCCLGLTTQQAERFGVLFEDDTPSLPPSPLYPPGVYADALLFDPA